ncbi:glutathione S-transferase [Entophlyctis helioformis]|nr:glutathione S-transferase [Entophlyctis helioformis]
MSSASLPLTANQLIGGTPTLTYFNVAGTKGRGELLRLFFHEAGIAFVDNRVQFADWPALKAKIVASGANPFGSLPVLELNGRNYTQSLPLLRLMADKLGKYAGSNDDERYFVDQVADIYIDWRRSWVTTLGGSAEALKTHQTEALPRCYAAFEFFLAKYDGPFVLGTDFSYADIALYQALNDDGSLESASLAAQYPRLAALAHATAARPNIAKYLEFRKQYIPQATPATAKAASEPHTAPARSKTPRLLRGIRRLLDTVRRALRV